MGRVIANGRVHQIATRPPLRDFKPGVARLAYSVNGKGDQPGCCLRAYGSAIEQVEDNMRTVREHFGANISDALRIALHLTAQAIRKNKALPEVKS